MVRDAEAHAQEDEARREAIELRNLADSMAYQGERLLEEHGDKIESATKLDLEQKIAEVREVLSNDPENIDRLRTSYQALTEVLSKAGASMYEQAGEAAPGPNGAEGVGDETAGADDEATIEGEYREVPN